ncbi:MAG TPA: FtsX-like permease family protein, partial [Polyangiaceae bacterium]|nr:FtsX-like permease family protein [Polyangiaceae bacterium]
MKGKLSTLGIIAQIALRNLFASRWKTLIVGGIVGFGAFLVVIGTSLLDSVDRSMSRSIIGSVAGDIQVYSSKSEGDLDVMGGFGMNSNDLDPLDDFSRVRDVVEKVPNVASVVPMGIDGALVLSGNTIDQALGKLRQSVTARLNGDASPELAAAYQAQKDHVHQIVSVVTADIENVKKLQADGVAVNDDLATVHTASSQAFWDSFDSDPYAHLELLENKVAPLAADADMLFLRYVGTDPAVFARSFDRMKIVEGEPIPEGKRGFLFSKYVYEEQVKLKTARGLDKIKDARENRHATIAADPELSRLVHEASRQVRELLLQLDAPKTALFRQKLQEYLHSSETNVGKLLEQFLSMDDQNFDERYAFFYRELAPSLELYRVRIGDTLTIKAFTKSGYVQSENLKVYGTFAFKGLEKSPQAGALNLMDMVSFRELYGFMTADRQKEIAALRNAAGAKEVSRENAEAELFGSAPSTAPTAVADLSGSDFDLSKALASLSGARHQDTNEGYDPAQLERGVVLNAAVHLKDETRLDETMAAIEAAGKQAGLPLKAISWQKAAGLIGQFTILMRVVLYTAVLIIFVVALVIINNALVMATLERVREIGTLRAIGAQRRFVLTMLILESIVVGVVFGVLGAALGALLMGVLGKVGIPAFNDVFMFFFSGPRLHPGLGGHNPILALAVVLFVSIVSSIYPAWIAMRI